MRAYSHTVTNLSASSDPAHVTMPHVHRVASLFKRWLLGTHQGGVSIEQLDFYVDEFTFRFNRRQSRYRGLLLFLRLLEGAVSTKPSTYRDITGNVRELRAAERKRIAAARRRRAKREAAPRVEDPQDADSWQPRQALYLTLTAGNLVFRRHRVNPGCEVDTPLHLPLRRRSARPAPAGIRATRRAIGSATRATKRRR
ncbi:MAG: hypothetical protein QOJ55_33 [Solirubrobacteraceae bacterium]|jgi:hypothetical protein|nr:hypothetical protein [Solirubrobacteraceae bacterium]